MSESERNCINCNYCVNFEYTLSIAHCGIRKSIKYPDKPMQNYYPEHGCIFYCDNEILKREEYERQFDV